MRDERRYGMDMKVTYRNVVRAKYWEGYMAGTCTTLAVVVFVIWVMG